MIKEVTEFIETKAGLTRDTDLFAGHRPLGVVPDPDDCDVVLESAGGSIFPELPERADTVFQVLSRAVTYMTARDRAYVIYDAIYRDWTLGSAGWSIGPILPGGDEYEIMVLEPLATPQYIGQDEKRRYEFSTNYLMKIKKL